MNHSLIARFLPASDRRAARQTLWMGGITAVQILGGLAQVSISARILGPEGFGVLAVIMAATALIFGLMALPGGSAVTTFVTRGLAEGRPDEASSILRFAMVVSLGLSLAAYAVIAAIAFTAAGLLGIDQAYTDSTLLYGVVGVLMAMQTETLGVLRVADRMWLGLVITLASASIRVALLAAVFSTGQGELQAVVIAHVVGAGVYGAGMFVAAAASASRAGIPGFLRSTSLKVPSDVLRFQTGTFGRTAISSLARHVDTILVAQFAGAADAGIYRASRQIMDNVGSPIYLLVSGVQPEYSRQWYSRQGPALRRIAFRFTLLAAATAAAIFGLLAVFREPMIQLILGDGFSGAATLLLILIPFAFVSSSLAVLNALPVATGRAWPTVGALAVGLAVSAAALAWLAPQYGAEGAAWARSTYTIVSSLTLLPFAISILRRSYRI